MATNYLYGTILTSEAVAANNRGDNIGNTTTLQKVFHQDDLHTSVSAESIRFAIRYRFQLEGMKVNREYDSTVGKLNYEDEKRAYWNSGGDVFIDDDLMGFMDAAAAKKDSEDEAAEATDSATEQAAPAKGAKKVRAKGTTTKRTSPLAVGRAVSLRGGSRWHRLRDSVRLFAQHPPLVGPGAAARPDRFRPLGRQRTAGRRLASRRHRAARPAVPAAVGRAAGSA